MKMRFLMMTLAVAVLSSVSLGAQGQRKVAGGAVYEGAWPKGEGVLYSQKEGMVLGTFVKGKPNGKCVCYRPDGEVYWGEFRRGKATGHAYLFREEGEVVAGMYRKGRLHGTDTVYCMNGSVYVGKFRNGKLEEKVYESRTTPRKMLSKKPSYPRIDFRHRQEEFIKEMELRWQNHYIGIKQETGFVHPKFQGGNVDDFTLWVNSHVAYPISVDYGRSSRTVLVEFSVLRDGSVDKVHTVFGSNAVLNEAAERAVKKSPRWTPAEYKGEKEEVRMTIPVVFNME